MLTTAARLTDVKITAESQEDLAKLYMARNLYLADEGKVNKDQELMLIRNFRENYEKGREQRDMKQLFQDIDDYMNELKHCGVKDWELKTLDTTKFWSILLLIRSALVVLIGCTIAVPGFIYISPIRWYLMRFAEKKRKEALKKSSVKILGNDVVASWKILIGVFITPLVINITNVIFLVFFSGRWAEGFLGRLLATFIFCVVLCSYLVMCVLLLNGINTHSRVCTVRFWVVLYHNRIGRARTTRKHLKKSVKEIMDKYSMINEQQLFKRKSVVDLTGKHHLLDTKHPKKVAPKKKSFELDTDEIFGSLVDIIG